MAANDNTGGQANSPGQNATPQQIQDANNQTAIGGAQSGRGTPNTALLH